MVGITALKAPAAEFVSTALLALVIVGSGHMASGLTDDLALTLLINGLAIAAGLAVAIKLAAPISGAHLNPVVTLVLAIYKKITMAKGLFYVLAQVSGATSGVLIANYLFDENFMQTANQLRSGTNLFVAEIIATAGLIWLILANLKKPEVIGMYVPLWIFSAIFFTSSTAFANPAISFARSFTDSFTGIAIASVPAFILAQLIGAGLGVVLARGFKND
jgi:glycerol uptake facilitator-like aquaporin